MVAGRSNRGRMRKIDGDKGATIRIGSIIIILQHQSNGRLTSLALIFNPITVQELFKNGTKKAVGVIP
jgi:hypothetical protein